MLFLENNQLRGHKSITTLMTIVPEFIYISIHSADLENVLTLKHMTKMASDFTFT